MILVTGASGHVGRTVVQALVQQGAQVRALVRDRARVVDLPAQVEVSLGDFGDQPSLARALQGVRKLFFVCLPEAGPARIQKHDNLILAAQRAGIAHVVYLSLLSPSPDSPIPQARWHYDTEQKLRSSGLPWTFLRASLYAQSLLSTAGVLTDGVLMAPAGLGRVAFVDRADVGQVAAACLARYAPAAWKPAPTRCSSVLASARVP